MYLNFIKPNSSQRGKNWSHLLCNEKYTFSYRQTNKNTPLLHQSFLSLVLVHCLPPFEENLPLISPYFRPDTRILWTSEQEAAEREILIFFYCQANLPNGFFCSHWLHWGFRNDSALTPLQELPCLHCNTAISWLLCLYRKTSTK